MSPLKLGQAVGNRANACNYPNRRQSHIVWNSECPRLHVQLLLSRSMRHQAAAEVPALQVRRDRSDPADPSLLPSNRTDWNVLLAAAIPNGHFDHEIACWVIAGPEETPLMSTAGTAEGGGAGRLLAETVCIDMCGGSPNDRFVARFR